MFYIFIFDHVLLLHEQDFFIISLSYEIYNAERTEFVMWKKFHRGFEAASTGEEKGYNIPIYTCLKYFLNKPISNIQLSNIPRQHFTIL